MELSPLEMTLALIVASLGGALLPLARRWSAGGLHLFAAVSAGIFLGTVFLHLQPQLAELSGEHDSAPWLAALGGFLGLFLLEKVWLRGGGASLELDGHTVLWVALLVGLSVHAFVAGIALSALLGASAGASVVVLPILWHKMTESFSLATVMKLAGVGNGRGLLVQILFSVITPAGLLLGASFAAGGPALQPVLLGFASGTFLYVAVCDLLPEVFHDLDRRRDRVLGLLAGVIAVGALPHHLDGDPGFVPVFLRQSLDVFVAMAPYLLGGFIVAGLISQLIRPAWLARHLSGNDISSVGIASVVGAPLPLCSCSVIPVAVALRRSGASKGATSAFLISTPETGIDSVSVTWALLDPLMTLVRPLAAVGSALFTGMTVSLFARSRHDDVPGAGLEDDGGGSCCEKAAAMTAPVEERPAGSGNLFVRALRYAFVDMLDDLAGALLAGILLSGLMTALIPDAWFDGALFAGASGLFVMLLIGVPIYVCAAASTPLAAAMVLKGLSPGAAIVFLLAGPATNMATLAVMARTLGARVVAVHIAGLATVTLVMGFAVDWLYRSLGRELVARAGEHHAAHGGWLGPACAVVFGLLLAAALWRTFVGGSSPAPDAALRSP
jgi:uncharacterized membrane protein YraQ (UPF0718 family)/zinc transporter ZupT